MKIFYLAFLASFLFVGCNTSKKLNKTMNSWLGSTKQALILQWGPPMQTASDGGNGEILVYAERTYYVVNGNPVDYWEYKMMYVNAEGVIYRWLYRRNPNPPNRVDIRLL